MVPAVNVNVLVKVRLRLAFKVVVPPRQLTLTAAGVLPPWQSMVPELTIFKVKLLMLGPVALNELTFNVAVAKLVLGEPTAKLVNQLAVVTVINDEPVLNDKLGALATLPPAVEPNEKDLVTLQLVVNPPVPYVHVKLVAVAIARHV